MKKILFIHHSTGLGGAPISMIGVIENLDKTNFQCKVLLLKESIIVKILEEKGIEYDIADGWFFKRFYQYFQHIVPSTIKWYQLKTIAKCSLSWILSRYYFAYKLLSKYDVDIIHLNSSVLTDWLAPAKRKAKVVMHIREPLSKGYFGFRHRFFTRQMRIYADKIIAISIDNSKRISIPNKTTVVYNFVETKAFSTSVDYESKKVLYVGGQSEIKGFKTVVDCLKFLDAGIVIQFVGYYNAFSDYSSIIGFVKRVLGNKYRLLKKMRVSKNHIEIGLEEDIYKLLVESWVLISPFSVEHFSRPVIEAFATSRPAIGTDVEGMDEIIDHNINGLIIKKNDPKALAMAINYLCANPEISIKMGISAYKKAITYFTADNVKQIELIYYAI